MLHSWIQKQAIVVNSSSGEKIQNADAEFSINEWNYKCNATHIHIKWIAFHKLIFEIKNRWFFFWESLKIKKTNVNQTPRTLCSVSMPCTSLETQYISCRPIILSSNAVCGLSNSATYPHVCLNVYVRLMPSRILVSSLRQFHSKKGGREMFLENYIEHSRIILYDNALTMSYVFGRYFENAPDGVDPFLVDEKLWKLGSRHLKRRNYDFLRMHFDSDKILPALE